MIPLLRYQSSAFLRSSRWIFPLIAYVVLISVGGAGSATQQYTATRGLTDGLTWSAAVLVPVGALLTRSMLTAEPAAARACVAAATGPGRAQLATLVTALAGSVVLGLAGMAYELVTTGRHAALAAPLLAGLVKMLVCALTGSAVGTLCNPPLVRHRAVALLSTIAAVVVAWVSAISPASAALHGSGATVQSAAWPAGVPLAAAVGLAALSWIGSCWAAGRRAG